MSDFPDFPKVNSTPIWVANCIKKRAAEPTAECTCIADREEILREIWCRGYEAHRIVPYAPWSIPDARLCSDQDDA